MTKQDAIKAAEAVTNDSPDITISLKDFAKARKALAAETSWKWKILSFLKNNQGATDLQVYEATRGPAPEEAKAKKSLASQYTYLRDEGALILKEEGKVYAITEPYKGAIRIVPGMEDKAKQLGLI
jgi:hypothetical protein